MILSLLQASCPMLQKHDVTNRLVSFLKVLANISSKQCSCTHNTLFLPINAGSQRAKISALIKTAYLFEKVFLSF